MPELSRFYGIVVTLNYDDHEPPHFHARYGDRRARSGWMAAMIAGSLSPRALGLVRSRPVVHAPELQGDWDRARAQLPLVPIVPLD